ncbi:MAG: hypothetical protein M0C28_21870 [Candidatus Moduliflexus flocculans]|nr:hypothetical protein [Candidatus Moduliflexus flocculans]
MRIRSFESVPERAAAPDAARMQTRPRRRVRSRRFRTSGRPGAVQSLIAAADDAGNPGPSDEPTRPGTEGRSRMDMTAADSGTGSPGRASQRPRTTTPSPRSSDAEFDELRGRARAPSTPGIPSSPKIGADAADGWPKARHLMPMGSQDKASSPEEFLAWCRQGRPSRVPRAVQARRRLPGAPVREAGALVRAVTRGDGEVGDEITPNAARMPGVLAAPAGAVLGRRARRGRHDPWRSTPAKYADKANCRNAANGLMKRKDGVGRRGPPRDLLRRARDALAVRDDGFFPDERSQARTGSERMGFETVPHAASSRSAEEVVD